MMDLHCQIGSCTLMSSQHAVLRALQTARRVALQKGVEPDERQSAEKSQVEARIRDSWRFTALLSHGPMRIVV